MKNKNRFTVYSDDPRFVKGEILQLSFSKVKVVKVSEIHKDITTKKILLEKVEDLSAVK